MKDLLSTILLLFLGLFSAVAQQPRTTMGVDFWTVFMTNMNFTDTNTALEVSITVSALRDCSFTIENPNTGWSETHNAYAGRSVKVVLPKTECYISSEGRHNLLSIMEPTNRCLHLFSTDTVSLCTANFYSASFDGASILPTPALGSEYIVQTMPVTGFAYPPIFSVTAIEDNTVVDIIPQHPLQNGSMPPANNFTEPMTVSLNRGQSIQVCGGSVNPRDCSGARVIARNNKKIVVINGNKRTGVILHTSTDHIYEQAVPVNSWGKHFILTATELRCKDVVRITASGDDTEIVMNGNVISTINANETFEFELDSSNRANFIETTSPSAMYLYTVTAANCTDSIGEIDSIGDPAMVWIAPIEQSIEDVVFSTFMPSFEAEFMPSRHFVNLVTKTENIQFMRIDNIPITSEFVPVPSNPQYSYARVEVSHGSHKITSNYGFTGHVYGLGKVVSYAYSVGSKVINLEEEMHVGDANANSPDAIHHYCIGDVIDLSVEVSCPTDSIIWTFGDETRLAGTEVSHSYTTEGNYLVEMHIYYPAGNTCSFDPESVHTFDIFVHQPYNIVNNHSARYGDTLYIQGNNIVAVSDTIIHGDYISQFGCDSLVTDNIFIRPYQLNGITAEICAGETYTLNNFNVSEAGTYYQYNISVNGTDSIVVLNLRLNANPQVYINSSGTMCNGGAELTASGNFEYLWSTGSTSQTIDINSPGTYSLTATDENSCTASAQIFIAPEVSANAEVGEIMCHGGVTQVEISAENGIGPYYGEVTETVGAGTYEYYVTDATGCVSSVIVEVVEPKPITLSFQTTDNPCYGDTIGTITASTNNGIAPYSYFWQDGTTDSTLNNLSAGFYYLTVSDVNGCTGTAAAELADPSEIELQISAQMPICSSDNYGSATINATGGNGGFNYSWSNSFNSPSVDSLPIGTYSLTVTDTFGCSASTTITISALDSIEINLITTNLRCDLDSSGAIASDVKYGLEPFSYFWSNGDSLPNITNLEAGPYTLTVTDGYGCTTQGTTEVTEPQSLEFEKIVIQDPTCAYLSDGIILLSTVGGEEPYHFSCNRHYIASPQRTHIGNGNYLFAVTDAMGCRNEILITLDSPESCLHIPNVFTPNADGINDYWVIEGIEKFPNAEVSVFNRWGQKLYSCKEGCLEGWNGRFRGHFVPAGCYTYIINTNVEDLKFSGVVTIIY